MDLYITTASIKKLGAPGFWLVGAFGVFAPDAAAVTGTHGALNYRPILVQQFGGPDTKLTANGSGDFDLGYMGGILAEIIDLVAIREGLQPFTRVGFHEFNRRSGAGQAPQFTARTDCLSGRGPMGGIKTRIFPTHRPPPGVFVLTAIDSIINDGTGSRLPLVIGANEFNGAIAIFQAQLGDQF